MSENTGNMSRWALAAGAAICVLGGGLAGWLWETRSGGSKAEVEQIVRNYILEHPEVLPEAIKNLRRKEDAKQLASVGGDIKTPYPGALLGNPDGKVTLVEFTDFACGYCRASVPVVEALIAANPDLKVVIRELPILSPASEDAARMGLAAAEQGKYPAFHKAMYAAGHLDARTIAAAAQAADLDPARAGQSATSPKVVAEIEKNLGMARELGFQGTPSWVIGDEIHAGAIGREALQKAIDKLRG